MEWQRKGRIFQPDGRLAWMNSHAQTPCLDVQDDGRWRVYFGTRDADNRTRAARLDLDPENPARIVGLLETPVLDLGPPGSFDDSGAMPSWVVSNRGIRYLYYTGWNVGVTVPFRNSIGVAISEDGGETYHKPFAGPIVDRQPGEPFFCAAPTVLKEGGLWRMRYLSCIKWEQIDGRPEPFYNLKYAESRDGIDWHCTGIVCIDFKSGLEAGIVRPSIIRTETGYRMWYCYRGASGYRDAGSNLSYRIGYAESSDGIRWNRQDDRAGITPSDQGWDSEMLAYPFVHKTRDGLFMLYNGNGFGHSGFGYATLVD